jgi:hypothetical protein
MMDTTAAAPAGEQAKQPDWPGFLAAKVREKSAQKQPASEAELRAALAEIAPEADFGSTMSQALAADPELAAVTGAGGETYYHCPGSVSATYARIMALKASALDLIAETVRDNARIYPRPAPLDIFELPPFDLTAGVIQECLRAMAASPEHADITFTTTSVGTVYLFSTRYLERTYAEFLAEQADVGLVENP